MQRHFVPQADITYSRWHHRPIGPHPDFNIQLVFPPAMFAAVTTFLALNCDGLTIFTHPIRAKRPRTSFANTATMPSGWGQCGR